MYATAAGQRSGEPVFRPSSVWTSKSFTPCFGSSSGSYVSSTDMLGSKDNIVAASTSGSVTCTGSVGTAQTRPR